MKYQRRIITLEELDLPLPRELMRTLNIDDPTIAAIEEELTNLTIAHIRLDGDDYETMCLTGRYRGADCVFMMHRKAIGSYSYECGVLNTTPIALQPTLEQSQRLAPWLTAIALQAYDWLPEDTNG